MAKLANIKKTLYYWKRNGFRKTWSAVWERLGQEGKEDYALEALPQDVWDRQREESLLAAEKLRETGSEPLTFDILVPAYRTPQAYLCEMIESLLGQSYPFWRLILADATEDDSVQRVAQRYDDARICLCRLPVNEGISENSNRGLACVQGDYVGLLDHDDFLTRDALFAMYQAIEKGKNTGVEALLLYSDEDKCDGGAQAFYEPNRKEDFNLDLLLSNNYICHFLVMKAELIQRLRFRREYDGAQDYDLVLRAVAERLAEGRAQQEIVHVASVLYHWRCHGASTAQNPASKAYAYEAGRRALQDFADRQGYRAQAVHLAHLGFYRLEYEALFADRRDIGAVGGKVLRAGRIAGGRMDADGTIYYEGLPADFSGPLHRAALTQDAYAADLRCIRVAPQCREIFERVTGVPYTEDKKSGWFDDSALAGQDLTALSLAFASALHESGYRILWDGAAWRKSS